MKKILFLTVGDKNLPSTRYRVYQWISFLELEGWNVKCIRARHIRLRKLTQIIIHSLTADVIYIQKKLPFRPFLAFIKLLNRNIIFDFDDALYSMESYKQTTSSLGYGSKKSVRRLNFIISKSRSVVVGNTHLKKYALRFNCNVVVIPTIIEPDDYTIKNILSENELSIGWIGTGDNQFYISSIKEALQKINKKYPEVIIKVISDKPLDLKGIRAEHIKWDLNNYKEELTRLNIGIMPLLDDEWSKGKCAFKLIQYMAAGVPVVASDIGSNSSLVTEGDDGFLVKTNTEWVDRLSMLIESAELRKKMGERARMKIKNHYSVEAWREEFESILLNEVG